MTTDAETKQKPAAPRGRSPNYPGIDLGTAIERARQMYTAQRQHDAPVASILETWGFTPTSGGGGVVLAALLRFGLIQGQGSGDERRARLTQDALAIIRDDREKSPDRDRLVRRLALLPPIHQELWTEYEGELPPTDAALRFDLIQRRGFTENGADEFIKEFRSTVAYAGLSASDRLAEDDGDEREDSDRRKRQIKRERGARMTVLTFQVSDRQVEIAVEGGPLTKPEIGLIKDYLAIQERVAPEKPEPEPVAATEDES